MSTQSLWLAGLLGLVAVGGCRSEAETVAAAAKPSLSRAHIEWCYKTYPTYRLQDNSYTGKDGKRHICLSPYS
jgi:hypothetical protein